MEQTEYIIMGIVLLGCSWTSYRIGVKEGIGVYIDYCKDISTKFNGMVMIMFLGKDIAFFDPVTLDKLDINIET